MGAACCPPFAERGWHLLHKRPFWVREFKIGQGRNSEMRLLKCVLNFTSPREFGTFSLIIIVGTVEWG